MIRSNKTWLCSFFFIIITYAGYGKTLTVPSCSQIYKFSEKDHIVNGYIDLSLPLNLTYLDLSMKLLISSPIFDQKLKISNNENELKNIFKNGGNVNYSVHFRSKNSTTPLESIYLNGNIICDNTLKKFHRKKRKRTSHIYLNNSIRLSYDGSFTENFKASKDFPKIIEPQETSKADRYEAITNTTAFDRRIRKRSVPDDCGITTITNSLIVGGDSAKLGEWPWLASIHVKYEYDLDFKCSGTLISDRHVITAGFCVSKSGKPYPTDPKDLLVKIGVHNIDDWVDPEVLKKEAKNIYLHPDFEKSMNNVGIVSFEPIKFSARVKPICLWSGEVDLDEITGKKGMVVGWGEDEDNDVIEIPQKISMPVVSITDCYVSKVKPLISRNTFCAGSRDGTGPCNNDGGDGFYMYINGRWRIRGIVSIIMTRKTDEKIKCDLNEYLIFSDIARHMSWVEKVLNE